MRALTKSIALPPWAHVSPERRGHIERVVALLDQWAAGLNLPEDEASRWHTAGILHDALRDAPEATLRALTGDGSRPTELLHGPAAAVRAEQDGERRQDVLQAVRDHTVGNRNWERTGKALYLADFLEPGRDFLVDERAAIAARVITGLDAAFREVVRLRATWALRQGYALHPETTDLWNAVR